MNDWEDPLKIELPECDYESAPENKSKDSDDSSIELPDQIRKPIQAKRNMEELKVLAIQMDEMKRQFADQLRSQNELIQNQSQEIFNLRTTTTNTHHPQSIRLSHAENVLKQFIKSPIKMFYDENPRKPI